MVDQIIEDATKAFKAIMDKSWIPWVARLVPKVAHQVREEAEAKAQEEHDRNFREEAKWLVDE